MIIRKANVNDYQAISILFNQSDNYHSKHEPYIYEKTESDFRTKEYIIGLISDASSLFYVLEVNNEVVGFMYAYSEEKGKLPIHKSRKYLVIDNICIKATEQNKGYGKSLIEYTINSAKELQFSDIILNVYTFNNQAINLYNTLGFKPLTQDMILKL